MRVTWVFAITLSLFAFSACGGGGDKTDGPGGAQCADGVDNDGDGAIDFPDDPGCAGEADDTEDSAPLPQCSDGRDNDGDGLTDYPYDPGCFAPQADDETDDCPNGPFCPQCANGTDDDQNGMTDYPDDPGCESAGDSLEFLNNPSACGGGMQIKMLPPTGIEMAALEGTTSTSMLTSPCGGGNGAPGFAYVMQLLEPKVVIVSTDDPATTVDTVIDIRGMSCAQPDAEIACNDNVGTGNTRSRIVHSMPAGIYYIIVQGKTATASGSFKLTVQQFVGENVACAMTTDCGPGLVCRTPVGGAAMVCSKPVCSDGLDDDGDNKIDFPFDPGCTSATDDTETDTCPGAGCPQCGNGIDDDGDMQVDYPDDIGCSSASAADERFCPADADFGGVISMPSTLGDLAGAADNFDQTCQGNTGNDRTYALSLPVPVTTLVIDTIGSTVSDTVVSLKDSTCTMQLGCDDDGDPNGLRSLLTVNNVPAGVYAIQVDAYSTGNNGAFKLNVKGTVATGTTCSSPLFAAGVLVCPTGTTCSATTNQCQ